MTRASVPASRASAAPVAPVAAGNQSGTPDPVEQVRIRATVGAAVRTRRRAAGLSQRALAALAGCHPRTIERLETGRIRPTTGLLAALAYALTVPPGYTPAGRRAAVDELCAFLEDVAGPSLVPSTPGGARRRRRRLRAARLAANAKALPPLRARLGRA